jgi:hypothetical protein
VIGPRRRSVPGAKQSGSHDDQAAQGRSGGKKNHPPHRGAALGWRSDTDQRFGSVEQRKMREPDRGRDQHAQEIAKWPDWFQVGAHPASLGNP